jgi:tetratricopeptide (TPR) repeat protein
MASIIGSYFRIPRVQIAALLYFIIAGALTQVPLFNYLGYEFSAVMTVPAALISGLLTILFLGEHRRKPLTQRTWLFVIVDYIHVNFLLLLIPLAVMAANAMVVKNCAFGKGIAFYLLLPVVTMIFSVSLALAIGTLFRRSKTVFVALIVLILLHIPYVTVTQPQLFAYNPVLGFFPGITYDETVGDLTTLTVYRQLTLIAALFCIIVFVNSIGLWDPSLSIKNNLRRFTNRHRHNRLMTGMGIFILGTLMTAYLYRSELGVEHTAGDIQRQLGRRTESKHFIIYYSATDDAIADVRRLRAESEYHYDVASARLNSRVNIREKIEVYLYPSAAVKQQFIGTSNTNIAKPWKREIHLTSASYKDSFRHELVHILAAEFGLPIVRASMRMGLNEGLAVAVDWKPGLFTPHQYAAALMRDGELNDVASLFTMTGFAARSSTYAYTVCGSFTKYLIDRYGIDRYKPVFAGGAFVRTFNETLENLVQEWSAFLKTVETVDIPPETVQAYFFHPPIFYKVCAREVAEKNAQGNSAIRVKDFTGAQRLFTDSYNDAPTAVALRGLMQALLAQQKYSEAIEQFDRLPDDSRVRTNPSVRMLYADAVYLQGQSDRATELVSAVIGMNISGSFNEAAALRKQIFTDRMDRGTFFALYYKGEEDSVKIRSVEDLRSSGTGQIPSAIYIMGMLHLRMSQEEQALEFFREVAVSSDETVLKYSATIRSAEIEYQRGRYEEAKVLYWNAKNYAPTPSAINQLDETIDLCDAVLLME